MARVLIFAALEKGVAAECVAATYSREALPDPSLDREVILQPAVVGEVRRRRKAGNERELC